MSCSSTLYVPVKIDPPTAVVYLNGEKIGLADKTNLTIDFGQHERICVQAVARGFKPFLRMYTKEELGRQMKSFGGFDWHMEQGR
ncbi:MAG: hypothetical protein ABIP94_07935 [Planctomycetota bacterium]